MKWIKRAFVVLAFVLVLFSVGLALVAFYKKEILAEVSAQLKAAIHAEVVIGDVDITVFEDFPNITLELNDIRIKDSTSRPGDRDLLSARVLLVNVRTYKLFFREIQFRSVNLVDGEFFVFRTPTGYSNLDVFKKRDTVATAADTVEGFRFTNDQIQFRNVKFSYHDSLRNKFIDFTLADVRSTVMQYDSTVSTTLEGAVHFSQLLFNPSRGAFLTKTPTLVNIAFNYYPDSSLIRLRPSSVALNESTLSVSGSFDFSPARLITLDIRSESLHYHEGLSVIPESIANNLSVLELERPFSIDVHLEAPMRPDELPSVLVRFGLTNNTFKSKLVTITDLSLVGMMTNHEDPSRVFNNANSAVHLEEIVGKVDELPFEAEAVLTNFDDLTLEIFSRHDVALAQLNREVDTTTILFTSGKFHSEFHYRGKLNEYFDEQTGTYKGTLDGKASVVDGAFTLVGRSLKFKDMSMDIRFNEDTVWLNNLNVTSGKSSAAIRGLITNYVPYFTRPVNRGFVKLDIASKNLDMGNFLTRKTSKKKSAREIRQDKRRVSDMLDKLFNSLEFDVNVAVENLKNRSFSASGVKGHLRLANNTLVGSGMKMNFGGGKLNVSMTMKDLDKEVNPVTVKANATNIQIKDLFRSFDNFSQKAITDKNLEGRVSFDTRFKVRINDDFNVLLPSLNGDLNMIIRDGRLINVEAIHNMSNFLFKRRDFDDVKFAQINGKMKIAHRDLEISRMEVQSSVLSLFLEGKYSLDNHTDLSIQLPLSNLKKRNKDFVPTNVGVDSKVGPSVFLIARTDKDGKTDISYDRLKLRSDEPKKVKKKKKG